MKKRIKRMIGGYLAVIMCVIECTLPIQAGMTGEKHLLREVFVSEVDNTYDSQKKNNKNENAELENKDDNTKEIINEVTTASMSNASKMSLRASTDEFVIDEKGILTEYNGDDEIIEIEEGVTGIASKVFEKKTKIVSVKLPDTMISIGNGAFAGCTNLRKINFPESLQTINPGAFKGTGLTEIQINSNLSDIKLGMVDGFLYASSAPFSDCAKLTKIRFGERVDKIPANLFKNCSGLQKLDLSESNIKEIGTFAFCDCKNLEEVVFNEGMQHLNMGAFAGCESLHSVTLSKDLQVLESVHPDSSGLSSKVTIPPFDRCSSLKNVILNEGTTVIPSYLFKNCTALEDIDLSNIAIIGKESFKGCTALVGKQQEGDSEKTLHLNSVKTVDANAFENCTSMKWIVFSNSVTSIEKEVLKGCTGLHYVTINAEYPKMDSEIFAGIENLTVRGITNSDVQTYVNNWNKSLSENHYAITFESKGVASGFKLGEDNWRMENTGDGIGRDNENHEIPESSFRGMFGWAGGPIMQKFHSNFIGYCYGFAETARIFHQQQDLFSKMIYEPTHVNVNDVKNKYEYLQLPTDERLIQALDLMEYFYLSQYCYGAPKVWAHDEKYKVNKDGQKFKEKTSEVVQELIQRLEAGEICTLRMRKSRTNITNRVRSLEGHAVLAYGIIDNGTNRKDIKIYDSNNPDKVKWLVVEKIDELWKWGYNGWNVGTLLSSESDEENTKWELGHEWDVIALIDSDYGMEEFEDNYLMQVDADNENEHSVTQKDGQLLVADGCSIKMAEYGKDAEGEYIADHELARQIAGDDGVNVPNEGNYYYVPNGRYTFTNDKEEGLEISLSSYESTAEIITSDVKIASVSLDDNKIDNNWVILNDVNKKDAQVVFKCYNPKIKFDELSVKGNGTQNQVTYTLKEDGNGLEVEGVALNYVEVIINDEKVGFNVKDNSGSAHIINLTEKAGKPVIQVLDDQNQVIAASDGVSIDNTDKDDNTGNGSNSGSTGGSSSGGNTGGSSSGGNTGGSSSGSNTGGSSGSSSGGSSGGGSGSRRSSGGGSSSSARNGLFITKPSYYGTGTWEGNETSTAWKLKTADGTTLALQWGLIDGIWYLFGMDGYTCTGWQLVNNQWYYFHPNAMMHTGWVLLDNHWYYLDSTGAMKTGWVLLDNRWYYLDSTGAMQTGWVFYNNQWYYLNADGSMLVNDSTPDGYAVGADGVWMP